MQAVRTMPAESDHAPSALSLERIADSLERIAVAMESRPTASPDISRSLADYIDFDWSRIGAAVVASDRYGATAVMHNGRTYTRRNPANKFGVAIWYSRAVGKGEDDKNIYERLITFRDAGAVDADPLNARTVDLLRAARSAAE